MTGIRCETTRGHGAIDALEPAWRGLAERAGHGVIGGPIWTRCFWNAFGQPGDELYLHTLYRGDEPVGVLPLRRGGFPFRAWSALVNSHAPRLNLSLAEAGPEAASAILDHLTAARDHVRLERLPSSSPVLAAIMEEARLRRLPVAVKESEGDAVLELHSPWALLRATLDRKLRKNTERALRQLRTLGALRFEVRQDTAELEAALPDCFELETRGWKGEHGVPMISRPDTARFYRELAAAGARNGWMALYTLHLDDRLIAFEYCLRSAGRIDLLKISYEPELAHHSPGSVLRWLVLESEADRGEMSTYHMGWPSAWKQRWASRTERLTSVRIYDDRLVSRLAWLAGPRLRVALKRRPWLGNAARRVRGGERG